MRLLLFLLVAAICVAGPIHYFTEGARARAARIDELSRLERQRDEVAGLLAIDAPTPTPAQTGYAAQRAEAIEGSVDRFVSRLLASSTAPAPDVDTLEARGRAAGVDGALLSTVMSSLDDGRSSSARRHALGAVLRAVARTGVIVESLEIGRSSARTDVPRLRFLPVELTVAGPLPAVVDCVERMIAGDEDLPTGDLTRFELSATDRDSWDRIGGNRESPPVRASYAVDLIVAGGG